MNRCVLSQRMRRSLVFISHDLGGIIVKMVRFCNPFSHHKADTALMFRLGTMDRSVREQ